VEYLPFLKREIAAGLRLDPFGFRHLFEIACA
jgi:hypothetical protein